MNSSSIEKVLENVYSLKKQRTLNFKLDEEIKQKSSLSPQKPSKLKSIHSHRPSLSSLPSIQTPIESVLAVFQRRQKLSSLFKSRLLPSQYLVTPAEILQELEDKVYTLKTSEKLIKEPKEVKKTIFYNSELKYERVKYEPGNNLDSHNFLQKSCQRMIQETKKSRKTLDIAVSMIRKRDLVKEVIEENKEEDNAAEFRRRLQKARTQLPGISTHSRSLGKLTEVC